ncbi:hypothetical protein T4E_6697 [Trichinella pseudospiralis]|uniref:Uncharacterized protein n=1 Tax=Trichinella pseudospiralis TaxID=6337 RepID=A0A0V1FDS2_TRIPS|nr:hypothetical protein T4E_6697 [Trichinella pseudospiralis]KRY84124.1 hypothetical protein T4D_11214 [Trichinella pseudospiralis]
MKNKDVFYNSTIRSNKETAHNKIPDLVLATDSNTTKQIHQQSFILKFISDDSFCVPASCFSSLMVLFRMAKAEISKEPEH